MGRFGAEISPIGAIMDRPRITQQEIDEALMLKMEADEKEIERLRTENAKLKTVMIAAAEEIELHWADHCDEEGYGPVNLMRRLEEGIPAEYGYTAGSFERLRVEIEALRKDADRYRWLRSRLLGADFNWQGLHALVFELQIGRASCRE